MATNIFSQGAPSSIFSENLKKSKLSILEIRTFDSKPTIYLRSINLSIFYMCQRVPECLFATFFMMIVVCFISGFGAGSGHVLAFLIHMLYFTSLYILVLLCTLKHNALLCSFDNTYVCIDFLSSINIHLSLMRCNAKRRDCLIRSFYQHSLSDYTLWTKVYELRDPELCHYHTLHVFYISTVNQNEIFNNV